MGVMGTEERRSDEPEPIEGCATCEELAAKRAATPDPSKRTDFNVLIRRHPEHGPSS
ncbi:hypothetical protein [Streptomyces sp. H39-C1]|uniref:hypothetical protein n=1 Tax=Streptomyces sp. H39-C1 TaxID=3004355 RepID=UPI0022AED241|nr:hypothetical protein [Streptomyces sp. H39-C1]MCZ4101704.1 hypothetical protein [Streptomyces sp. H39-C1]